MTGEENSKRDQCGEQLMTDNGVSMTAYGVAKLFSVLTD